MLDTKRKGNNNKNESSNNNNHNNNNSGHYNEKISNNNTQTEINENKEPLKWGQNKSTVKATWERCKVCCDEWA